MTVPPHDLACHSCEERAQLMVATPAHRMYRCRHGHETRITIEAHRLQAFGTWDAPATDGAEWLDEVPDGLVCMHCREKIFQGDNGAIMPNGYAQHRECSIRGVLGGIGHIVDHETYCHGELGPDAGLSYRESALLVWRHNVQGHTVTRSELAKIITNKEGEHD